MRLRLAIGFTGALLGALALFGAGATTYMGFAGGAASFHIIAGGGTPTFSVTPVYTKVNNTTERATYTAGAAGMIGRCGLYVKGVAAPTAADIAGGVTAHGISSLATTGASQTQDTTTTDSPALPAYDEYCVIDNGGGVYTAVPTTTTVCLDPPTGKQYVNCPTGLTSVAAGSPVATFNVTVTPDIAAGDIEVTDALTSPSGFALVAGLDGNFSYTGGLSRQSWTTTFYDNSVGAYHVDTMVTYNNNQGPVCGAPDIDVVLLVGVPMTPYDLDLASGGTCSDPEGDLLTSAVTSGTLPAGLTLNGSTNVTSGTPTVENEAGVAITYTLTDIAGATTTKVRTYYPVISWTLGNYVTEDIATARGQINTLTHSSANIITVPGACNAVAGTITAQNPASGGELAPFATISLTVTHNCGSGSGSKGVNLRRRR